MDAEVLRALLKSVDTALHGWEDPHALFVSSGVTFSGFGDGIRDYVNASMRLSLEFHLAKLYIRAHILRKADETGVTVHINYKDSAQLMAVLGVFQRRRDAVTPHNWQEVLTEVAATGAELAAETEQGLRKIQF